MADETTSEEDAYNARKQLVEIQDEVVAKYGLQKDSNELEKTLDDETIKTLIEAYCMIVFYKYFTLKSY